PFIYQRAWPASIGPSGSQVVCGVLGDFPQCLPADRPRATIGQPSTFFFAAQLRSAQEDPGMFTVPVPLRPIVLGWCSLWITSLALAAPPDQGPTFADVSYGPHPRQVLDFWRAGTERPAPLVVFIHGGGFVGGDKAKNRNPQAIGQCLEKGVH